VYQLDAFFVGKPWRRSMHANAEGALRRAERQTRWFQSDWRGDPRSVRAWSFVLTDLRDGRTLLRC
jgi:hypothetical protein